MPIPLAVARFNRGVTNHLIGRFAGKLRLFALVEHRGRKTGTIYQTPVMLFHHGGRLLIALTYGPDTDWLRNIRAAGGCVLIERGRRIPAIDPVVDVGPNAIAPLPRIVRLVLSRIEVDQVLHLTPASAAPPTQNPVCAVTRLPFEAEPSNASPRVA